MVDAQSQLFPNTESGVDRLWAMWQRLSEAQRSEFLIRVRNAWLTKAISKIPEHESNHLPHHHRPRRRN